MRDMPGEVLVLAAVERLASVASLFALLLSSAVAAAQNAQSAQPVQQDPPVGTEPLAQTTSTHTAPSEPAGSLYLAHDFSYSYLGNVNKLGENRQISHEVTQFLESKGVVLVSDQLRKDNFTTQKLPVPTMLNIVKDAGASHLLHLTMYSAPLGSDKGLKLECFDLSANKLWEEGTGGRGRKAVEKLKTKLEPRIGTECLPVASADERKGGASRAAQETSAPERASQNSASSFPVKSPTAPAIPPSSAPPPPHHVLLKEGTEVLLQLAQDVKSEIVGVGAFVEFRTAEDLRVEGSLVVRKGSRVLGTVVPGEKKGIYVDVNLVKAGLVAIKLRGTSGPTAPKRHKGDIVATAALTAVAPSAIFLLPEVLRKHYTIKEGTPVTAYVADDTEVPVLTN